MQPGIAIVALVSLLTATVPLVGPALQAQSDAPFAQAATRPDKPLVLTIETEATSSIGASVFDPALYTESP